MKATPSNAIYFGHVMHERHKPFTHRFRYRSFSLFLDLETLPSLAADMRLFSYNRFGLFSFHDRDHGARDGSSVLEWVRAQLRQNGLGHAGAQVHALCFPRILGYVFNPLTIYFCRDGEGRLSAILYEVKNTFGEQHCYLTAVQDEPVMHHAAEKNFYVSPFIAMKARYHFRVAEPEERLHVLILETEGEDKLLTAAQTGRRAALNDRGLAKAFFAYPLLTLHVIVGIHWQALKLWLKGARYHARPAPPSRMVERIDQA